MNNSCETLKWPKRTHFRVNCVIVCDALRTKFFNESFGIISNAHPNTIHENFVDIRVANSGRVVDISEEINKA